MSTQISVRLDDEMVQMLDERAAQEGGSRAELIEFALRPLMKHRDVRPLILPPATIEMLQRIADGQGVERTDVMRRALIDYAHRAAIRWQINARADQRVPLHALQARMDGDPSIETETERIGS